MLLDKLLKFYQKSLGFTTPKLIKCLSLSTAKGRGLNNGFLLFTLQLEFFPSPSGAYQFATVNPRYFNKLDCDGVFKKIESKTADSLANDIINALEELRNSPSTVPQPAEELQTVQAQKRPLTPLFQIASCSKRQKMDSQSKPSHVKSVQASCDECQLDNKYAVRRLRYP